MLLLLLLLPTSPTKMTDFIQNQNAILKHAIFKEKMATAKTLLLHHTHFSYLTFWVDRRTTYCAIYELVSADKKTHTVKYHDTL